MLDQCRNLANDFTPDVCVQNESVKYFLMMSFFVLHQEQNLTFNVTIRPPKIHIVCLVLGVSYHQTSSAVIAGDWDANVEEGTRGTEREKEENKY